MALLAEIVQFIPQHPFAVLCLLVVFALSGLSVYRLFLHPLAKFPGPKLAALTLWYEYYHDGIRGGQYTFEIQRMHERYGPIVRISPHELHINDPAFIDTLYAGGGKRRDKYVFYASQFGLPKSLFGTADHYHHRLRRSALRRFFSKASVTQLEPLITKKIDTLCSIIQATAGSGRPVSLSDAYSAITSDVATEYAFGTCTNFVCPSNPYFQRNFRVTLVKGLMVATHSKQFPWIRSISNMIPISVLRVLDANLAAAMEFQMEISKQVKDVMDGVSNGNEKGHNTIFHELLTGSLPPQEKTFTRLKQEGQLIVGAGTETVGWSLSVITFYILAHPAVLEKLRKELEEAIPDPSILPSVTTLENLPYLSAVVAEGLRLSYGVISRSQRISPYEPLIFEPASDQENHIKHVIPAGTPVGMTSYLIHHNPEIFPDSSKFIPERWLDQDGKRHRHLDPYLMTFSKGSRQCIGINLAYAELYLIISSLIRRFGGRMELFETTMRDVVPKKDYFLPVPDSDAVVQVLVRED
ncbi:conserved hypothetical protein [Coccidioides posadasii str. Silveira]|uniref:Cytochrome P450 n=1 Tax=Coccidioides posadasii (strain RMSCC 757 / Silveira) TaxID=443226 RepID=E9DC72_COCPS|nr:conserved hypothetical protein [Coccidioides posadasii str. Silveira]